MHQHHAVESFLFVSHKKWVVTGSQKQVKVFPSLKDLFFGGCFGLFFLEGGGGGGVGLGFGGGVCQKMETERGWGVEIAG